MFDLTYFQLSEHPSPPISSDNRGSTVHVIEWRSRLGLDRTNWGQVMDHFLKGLCDFCAYFHEVYIHGMF